MGKWTVIYQETVYRSTVYEVEADSRDEAIQRSLSVEPQSTHEKDGDCWFDTYEPREAKDE